MALRVRQRRPAWVPNEVWAEYQQCIALVSQLPAYDDVFQCWRDEQDVFTRLISDVTCAEVWSVVCSRREDSTLSPIDLRRTHPAGLFLLAVANAWFGLQPEDRLSRAARKKLASTLAADARRLHQHLLEMIDVAGVPRVIRQRMGDRLTALALAVTSPESPLPPGQPRALAYNLVGDLFFETSAEPILLVLAEAMQAWGAQATYAYHSGDSERIRRDYFIRAMTAYFTSQFGQPHRRRVALLVACFFNEVVTERDIRRIATQESAPGAK